MRSRRRRLMPCLVALGVASALGGCFVACGAYDADLIKGGHDTAADASPPDGLLLESSMSTDVDGLSASPDDPAGQPRSDPDSNTRCGDGLVTGVEKCDVAIPDGMAGACPTACPDIEKCVPRVLNGTGCQAACELRPILCQGGDGCCSGNCTTANDSDCSPSCGDGMLQPPETCDDGSSKPCGGSAADCDDGDPCTTDMPMGSADACNVTCAHLPISELHAGDRCCPEGANANTDGDCIPSCGNGVHEDGEECDGVEGCSADCKLTLQPDQIACLRSAGDDACRRCACMNCPTTELACWATDDMTTNMLCSDMVACARSASCYLDACYCGAGVDVPACLISAQGPCKSEVEAAAGTSDPIVIDNRKLDTSTPLGKAYAADQCRVMQCQEQCR